MGQRVHLENCFRRLLTSHRDLNSLHQHFFLEYWGIVRMPYVARDRSLEDSRMSISDAGGVSKVTKGTATSVTKDFSGSISAVRTRRCFKLDGTFQDQSNQSVWTLAKPVGAPDLALCPAAYSAAVTYF